jgi:hypothetical protein|nr:MAG TPA: hypothetical protein [Bacteriophage sp.]
MQNVKAARKTQAVMQAPFLLEEATMEVLLLPLQRRDLCASALCCVGGDAEKHLGVAT